MSVRTPEPGDRLDKLIKGQLEKRPDLSEEWGQTELRRELASALIRLRKDAGLTQTQVAETAGWDQSYVSKLESALGPWPTHTNLERFSAACGADVALVFVSDERPDVFAVGTHFGGTDRTRKVFRRVLKELEREAKPAKSAAEAQAD